MKSKYIYGIKRVFNGYKYVVVNLASHWENKRREYGTYIPDKNINTRIEETGNYEIMENTYDFGRATIAEIKEIMSAIPNMEFSQDFTDYINREEE